MSNRGGGLVSAFELDLLPRGWYQNDALLNLIFVVHDTGEDSDYSFPR